MLAMFATLGGSVIGVLEAQLGASGWVLCAGLSLLAVGTAYIGARWIWRPYENLVRALERITLADRPGALIALPLLRHDETGKLARSLHQLTSWAIRDHREARLVRRTLDERVAHATEKATRQFRRMAMRDALTDLGNRRFLDDNLDPLMRSVRASMDDLVCMVMDVDNFKKVNDSLGHAAGDELLILLGSLIRASIRHSDYAVRVGGDEFVLLLPSCDPQRAKLLAHRLSVLFTHHTHTSLPVAAPVSLSIGIASLRHDGARNGRELVEIADRKLYEAKRAGKATTVGV